MSLAAGAAVGATAGAGAGAAVKAGAGAGLGEALTGLCSTAGPCNSASGETGVCGAGDGDNVIMALEDFILKDGPADLKGSYILDYSC